jgi:phosphatidylethanolamine/phosphatidyl-N-methylethanolamine N-methyltransferase
MSAVGFSSRYDCLKEAFLLNDPKEITAYFPEKKGKISEIAKTKFRRIAHWFQTGIWISEKTLLFWLREGKDHKVSPLFEKKHLYRKILRCEQKREVPRRSKLQKFAEASRFFVRFISCSDTVGAVLPSSSFLAKEIVSEIKKLSLNAPGRRILEIGPGTGVFTDKIIKRMNPQDVLDIVEFDKTFSDELKEKYKHLKNVHVYHMSILDYTENLGKYDHIVSGVPLNSLPADFTPKYFDRIQELSKKGGTLSYFEYILLPEIKQRCLSKEKMVKFKAILDKKKAFYEEHKFRSQVVLPNIPPAKVLHHKL